MSYEGKHRLPTQLQEEEFQLPPYSRTLVAGILGVLAGTAIFVKCTTDQNKFYPTDSVIQHNLHDSNREVVAKPQKLPLVTNGDFLLQLPK